jgi:hypothetical protein
VTLAVRVAGALAALQAPWWLEGRRLQTLLADQPVRSGRTRRGGEASGELAVAAAWRALGRLGRVPGGRWRNTCLYRAAAACLALRRCGVPARLRLGVRRDGSAILAHAWVEDGAGRVLAGGREGHRELRSGAALVGHG